MSVDEKISRIKIEIENQEGKEWLGMKDTTEKRLESLLWYLEHPKIKEFPRLLEEAIDLYFKAKESGFLKMEGIIRKLDQLNIKLGKFDYEKEEEKNQQKKRKFLNYSKTIKDLRKKIQILLQSPLGTSLPEKTQESLMTLMNYLNHPDLKTRPQLFDELYEIYEKAEKNDFMQMQAFNHFLNKLEIKLGSLTKEMKSFKTIEEKMEEFEEEKLQLQERIQDLENEKKALKEEKREFEMEKQDIAETKQRLEIEREEFEKVQNDFEEQINSLQKEVKQLKENNQELRKRNEDLRRTNEKLVSNSETLNTIEEENKILKEKVQKLDEKVEKVDSLEEENKKLMEENRELSNGLKKLEGLIQQFEEKRSQI